jgi:hypothetical protein
MAGTTYVQCGGHNLQRSEFHISPFSAAKREDVMRRVLMLFPVVVAVVACAKTETPPAAAAKSDTGMAPATAPAVAPTVAPALTEADVAGTWKGTNMPMGSDSVVAKWTQVCAAGSCKGTVEGSKVAIHAAYTMSGDSAVGVSKPFASPAAKGAKVIDTWVVRVKGDTATGTGAMKLASKPDSVVMAYHFAGSRAH